MKIQKTLTIVPLMIITGMFVAQASARSEFSTEDGIAASPKVRAVLNERLRSANFSSSGDKIAYRMSTNAEIAASPKVRQAMNESSARRAAAAASDTQALVNVEDGIAASPKVRSQLNGRISPAAQIAPLK